MISITLHDQAELLVCAPHRASIQKGHCGVLSRVLCALLRAARWRKSCSSQPANEAKYPKEAGRCYFAKSGGGRMRREGGEFMATTIAFLRCFLHSSVRGSNYQNTVCRHMSLSCFTSERWPTCLLSPRQQGPAEQSAEPSKNKKLVNKICWRNSSKCLDNANLQAQTEVETITAKEDRGANGKQKRTARHKRKDRINKCVANREEMQNSISCDLYLFSVYSKFICFCLFGPSLSTIVERSSQCKSCENCEKKVFLV